VTQLLPHPAAPAPHVRDINLALSQESGQLQVVYRLEAELASLRIPAPGPGERLDDLWKHTCFELFIMVGDGPSYEEYNFSPSGDWAHYHFVGYRDGMASNHGLSAPLINVYRNADYLELRTTVQIPDTRPLRLGLSAVIEDISGHISYWALRHPSDKPDFHHSDAFALELK